MGDVIYRSLEGSPGAGLHRWEGESSFFHHAAGQDAASCNPSIVLQALLVDPEGGAVNSCFFACFSGHCGWM